MAYNALESLQAFELGTGQRKERERETAMKGIGNALAGGDIGGATAQAFKVDPMYGMQIQQYGDQRNALDLRKDIGGMVGAGDRKGAAAKAYASGEFELGAGIDAQIAQMTQQQRQDALFLSEQMGNAAMTLKGIEDPQQRLAQWQQMQSRFVNEFGMQPEALAQFDPTDPMALDRAIGEAQDFAQRLSGQRADEQFAYTQKIDERNFNRGVYEYDTARADANAAAKAKAEADAAAAALPNVDDEGQFRREYNTVTKDFRDVQAAYGRIKATDANTPAGQLSLVFQYMKMLDPGSTVREGEFANAENARGVPDGVLNIYNKVANGQPLTASQVADFQQQAGNLYNQALTSYDTTRQTYEGIAGQYGFEAARTVPDLASMRPAPPVADAVTAPEVGVEEDGFVYMGGNPADPNSWKKKEAGNDFRFFNTPGVR